MRRRRWWRRELSLGAGRLGWSARVNLDMIPVPGLHVSWTGDPAEFCAAVALATAGCDPIVGVDYVGDAPVWLVPVVDVLARWFDR